MGLFDKARAIQDTSEWEWPRNLEHLAKFLKKSCGKLKPVSSSSKGSPHTLIVAGSGIRAVNLTRYISQCFVSGCLFAFKPTNIITRALKEGLPTEGVKAPKVGKLFAKHIKLKDAIGFCSQEGFVSTFLWSGEYSLILVVWTSASALRNEYQSSWRTVCMTLQHSWSRVLIPTGALKCSNLKHIVIDASYIDEKKRGILDMKDLHKAVLDLLLRPEFKDSDGGWDDQFRLILY